MAREKAPVRPLGWAKVWDSTQPSLNPLSEQSTGVSRHLLLSKIFCFLSRLPAFLGLFSLNCGTQVHDSGAGVGVAK